MLIKFAYVTISIQTNLLLLLMIERGIKEYSIFSNKYKFYRKQKLTIDQAVNEAIRYCLEHNIMTEYLRNNEKEVIDMFWFEWNEKEEKDALIKVG